MNNKTIYLAMIIVFIIMILPALTACDGRSTEAPTNPPIKESKWLTSPSGALYRYECIEGVKYMEINLSVLQARYKSQYVYTNMQCE